MPLPENPSGWTDLRREADPLLVELAEPAPRGWPVLAWIVVLALVGCLVWIQNNRPADENRRGAGRIDSRILVMQSRILVAAKNLTGQSDPRLNEQLDALPVDSPKDRLRLVIVVGEVLGPEAARTRLGTARHLELAEILDRAYQDYQRSDFEASSLQAAEKDRLRSELGWFGELALTPAGSSDGEARSAVLLPAYQTFLGIMGGLLVAGVIGLAGFIGLIVYAILLLGGKIPPLVSARTGRGGIYAETFAVWLVLFLGLNLLASLLPLPKQRLALTGLGFLMSLAALAWPVVRGISWKQVREDVGLTVGSKPFLEPWLGIGTYALAIPLAVLGVMVTMLLLQSALGQGKPAPTHPAAEEVLGSGWWGRVQILVLACIAAPLVEEIFFRGVLYRHLREGTCRWTNAASVVGSALLVSLVFAVIHPQGVFGVPPLMGLAFAFTLAREWRGTLVPAMVAHAINNGVMMFVTILLFGD